MLHIKNPNHKLGFLFNHDLIAIAALLPQLRYVMDHIRQVVMP
jgi:hypothetical protein